MATNTPELLPCPLDQAVDILIKATLKQAPAHDIGRALGLINEYRLNHRAGETTWQDISSAPRDGSLVLTLKTGLRTPAMASFHYGCWDILDREDIEWRPTHWMPLPLPPTGENK